VQGAQEARHHLQSAGQQQDEQDDQDDPAEAAAHARAANVWRDLQQRRKAAGQVTMPVYRINLPISKLYHIAVAWTDEFGILPAAGGPKKKKK